MTEREKVDMQREAVRIFARNEGRRGYGWRVTEDDLARLFPYPKKRAPNVQSADNYYFRVVGSEVQGRAYLPTSLQSLREWLKIGNATPDGRYNATEIRFWTPAQLRAIAAVLETPTVEVEE